MDIRDVGPSPLDGDNLVSGKLAFNIKDLKDGDVVVLKVKNLDEACIADLRQALSGRWANANRDHQTKPKILIIGMEPDEDFSRLSEADKAWLLEKLKG